MTIRLSQDFKKASSRLFSFGLFFFIFLLITSVSGASELLLSWDIVVNADGYVFYYGNEAGNYCFSADVDNKTAYPITSFLIRPRDHHFAVRSYRYDNGSRLFSSYSENYNLDFRNFDTDRDDLVYFFDNCPSTYNPAQKDTDNDTIGDLCDNCPLVYNPSQADGDHNGTGNACQTAPDDTDSDGIPDIHDNCPAVPNPAQQDMDNDTAGDVCDEDIDGDGIDNEDDNCTSVFSATDNNTPECLPESSTTTIPYPTSTTTTVPPSSTDSTTTTTTTAASSSPSSGGSGGSSSGGGISHTPSTIHECLENDDCGKGLLCRKETGMCVECIKNADCAGRGVCYTGLGTCVECIYAVDCDDGLMCNGLELCFNMVCVPGDPPCSSYERCDEEADSCMPQGPPPECFSDADCNDGLFCNGIEMCNSGRCAAGNRPCTPLQSCNETRRECTDIHFLKLPQNRTFKRPFFRMFKCPVLIIMLEQPRSDTENIIVSIEGQDPSFTGVEVDLSRSSFSIGPYLVIPFCISRNASPGLWRATIERTTSGTSYIEIIETSFEVK